jgi:cation:H+ antiporter
VVAGLLLGYVYYLILNLRESAEGSKEEPLMFDLVWVWMAIMHPTTSDRHELRRTRRGLVESRPPHLNAVLGQVALALGLIVLGAYVFVEATQKISLLVGFSPLVFALVIAPVATELPEKFNSVIWIRQGKDTLSLGNISGAMVFQSTIPVTLGILLTDWHFGPNPEGRAALLSAAIALVSAATFFVTLRIGRSKTVAPWPLLLGLGWWLAYLAFVVITVVPH